MEVHKPPNDAVKAGRLVRLPEVLKILPVSKSTWWQGVASGRYPQPVKLGPRLTCWHSHEIEKLIESGV